MISTNSPFCKSYFKMTYHNQNGGPVLNHFKFRNEKWVLFGFGCHLSVINSWHSNYFLLVLNCARSWDWRSDYFNNDWLKCNLGLCLIYWFLQFIIDLMLCSSIQYFASYQPPKVSQWSCNQSNLIAWFHLSLIAELHTGLYFLTRPDLTCGRPVCLQHCYEAKYRLMAIFAVYT